MRESNRHRRQKLIDRDVAFLKSAIKQAPTGDPSVEEMAEIYSGIRRQRVRKK